MYNNAEVKSLGDLTNVTWKKEAQHWAPWYTESEWRRFWGVFPFFPPEDSAGWEPG